MRNLNLTFRPIAYLAILCCTVFYSLTMNGQCTNTTGFGTFTAPSLPGTLNMSTCIFAGEYNTINGAVAGQSYTFTGTGGAGNFLTVRQGTSGGAVLGFGTSPITVTCTVSGPIYLHVNTSSACGTDATCHTTSITCTSCVAPPVPSNDLCANATNIVGCTATFTNQTNVGATNDAFPTCNLSGTLATGAPNVWYKFIGTGKIVTITTCSSPAFDTEIGVFSGSCGSLVCVANSDQDDEAPGCGVFDETVAFMSTLGTIYYIMIQGHNGATGTFTLNYMSETPNIFGWSFSASCASSTVPFTVSTPAASGTNVSYNVTPINPPSPTITNNTGVFNLFPGEYNWFYVIGGCTSETFPSFTIPVPPLVPPASISVAESSGTPNDGTICNGQSATLTANSAASYAWNTAATTESVVINTAGTYTVTVTYSDGCTSTASTTITVIPALTLTGLTLTQPTTCTSNDGGISYMLSGSPSPYTYAWTTSNGSGLVPNQQNQSALSIGTYNLVATSSSGCTANLMQSLSGPGNCGTCPVISGVNVNAVSPNCVGIRTLQATGLINIGPTYSIRFVQFTSPTMDPYTGGLTLATVPVGLGVTSVSANVNFNTSSTYYIYAVASPEPSLTCRPFASTTLTINPSPIIGTIVSENSGSTSNDGIICSGGSATITAFGGPSYFWSTAATTASITVSPTLTSSYVVTVVNAQGCSSTAIRTITVSSNLTSYNVTGTGTICLVGTGLPVGLNGSQTGVNYQLQRNAVNVGSPIAGTGSALTFPNQTLAGTYTVVATSTSTSCTSNMTGSAILTLDTQNPTITCPANISQNVDPNTCSKIVNFVAATGTDNCGPPAITQIAGLPSGTSYSPGTYTITYRATDNFSNSSTCSFTITVVDNILPTITCPPNIVELVDIATCRKTINYVAPVGTDNCPDPVTIRTTGNPSGTSLPPGVTTNTFRVTDAAGNTATCAFTVTLQGGPPVITCPAPINVFNDSGQCGAVVSYIATASNAYPPATITYSRPPGSFFEPGFHFVTATASNSCGASSCTFSVNVQIGPDGTLAAAYTAVANTFIGLKQNTVNSGGIGLINPNGTIQLTNNTSVTNSNTFARTSILTTNSGSTVNNHQVANVNSGILPSFIYSTPYTYNNVVVPDNTTKVLELDSYGDITVGNNATIIFSGNTQVKIKQLILRDRARISCNQDMNILVKGLLSTGAGCRINTSNAFIRFYVDANIVIGPNNTVNANMHTLRHLNIQKSDSGSTNMTGLFIAHQISAQENVIWNRDIRNCTTSIGNISPETKDDAISQEVENREQKLGSFIVFPNPSSDILNVEISDLGRTSILYIKLQDAQGRIIISKPFIKDATLTQTFNIDITDVPPGIYFIQISDEKDMYYREKVLVIK
jgi:hypothetical protein